VTERLLAKKPPRAVPIHPLSPKNLKAYLRSAGRSTANWVKVARFEAEPNQLCLVPRADGTLSRVLLGVGEAPWAYGVLATALPAGAYFIDADLSPREADRAMLSFALGTYQFTRYKKKPKRYESKLVWHPRADRDRITHLAEGISLARDLVNYPANDLGPEELAEHAKSVAKRHQAKFSVIVGDALLEANYPAVHAVGRASARAPRLCDIQWGNPSDPKVTIVGKGVCFDSGGLDLKSSANMRLMKKDMGGAATVLGLAHAIMAAKLSVRLRVLVPAVENSVSGNAMRPLDVLSTRKGLSVEVGNTDAEGRLILFDALVEADSEDPEVLVDVATLTGAARVALGPSLPALFANDDALARDILAAGVDSGDRLWRLPLHDDYRPELESPVADLSNVSQSSYGGAISAALFLREFVKKGRPWAHIDTMAWNVDSKPGRPAGGEAFGLVALFTMLERRYAPRAKSAGEPERAATTPPTRRAAKRANKK
jgi:leucyl aminopeptidase